jgi:4-hydroxybenzoate polyprenyltransferase
MPFATGLRTAPGTALSLALAAHPALSLLVAAGAAAAAAVSGRSAREVALVLATVLVGRVTAGWLDDVADRERDRAAQRPGRPIARGWLHPGTATFAVACTTCLLVPLSVANGTVAGAAHLGAVLAAWLSATRLALTPWSWVPWG